MKNSPGDSTDLAHEATASGAAAGVMRQVGRIPGLRSTWWLLKSLYQRARTRPRQVVANFDQLFQERPDPWSMYSPGQQARFVDAAAMLDKVSGGRKFGSGIELGCAEGTCTRQILAARCDSLLATDVSSVALERARTHCAGFPHVRFALWDILADAPPGAFDLAVVMSVMEPFYRKRDLLVARQKMVDLTAPNGYLFLSNTMHGFAEGAWWGRWMIRGANWQSLFIAQHPKLRQVDTFTGPFYVHTLFRRVE